MKRSIAIIVSAVAALALFGGGYAVGSARVKAGGCADRVRERPRGAARPRSSRRARRPRWGHRSGERKGDGRERRLDHDRAGRARGRERVSCAGLGDRARRGQHAGSSRSRRRTARSPNSRLVTRSRSSARPTPPRASSVRRPSSSEPLGCSASYLSAAPLRPPRCRSAPAHLPRPQPSQRAEANTGSRASLRGSCTVAENKLAARATDPTRNCG